MSTIRRISLLWLISLAATVCHADDSRPSNAKHLHNLGWVIGNWTAAILAERDIPGVVAKGDHLRLEMPCQWGLQQNVIAVTWDVKAGKSVLVAHKGMIGWNAVKKKIVSVGFDSTGKYAASTWSNDKGKWRLDVTESNGSGESSTKTNLISEIQSDQFTYQRTKEVTARQSQPPRQKIVFKRAK